MRRALILMFTLALAASPATASLNGSSAVLLAPGAANPGDTAVFTFSIENGSIDGESIREVKIIVPGDADVVGGWYDDNGQNWNLDFTIEGVWDNFGIFRDNDGNPGEIGPGEIGYFYLEVELEINMDCGPNSVDVRLYGDDAGDSPHWINFDDQPFQVCGVPTDSGTWSSVKGLYR